VKEAELRERAVCAHCERKIGEGGMPIFYTVRLERHMVDMNAAKAQTGLAMMLGSARLASVMGPDEEMTTPMMEPGTITICERCSTESICVAMLAEYVYVNAATEKEAT
jgi:hypothetical protein